LSSSRSSFLAALLLLLISSWCSTKWPWSLIALLRFLWWSPESCSWCAWNEVRRSGGACGWGVWCVQLC
jgi:hypothetical protein